MMLRFLTSGNLLATAHKAVSRSLVRHVQGIGVQFFCSLAQNVTNMRDGNNRTVLSVSTRKIAVTPATSNAQTNHFNKQLQTNKQLTFSLTSAFNHSRSTSSNFVTRIVNVKSLRVWLHKYSQYVLLFRPHSVTILWQWYVVYNRGTCTTECAKCRTVVALAVRPSRRILVNR